MATTVLAPKPISLRRRILRDGPRLLANEAADLVDVPGTTNLATVVREWVASLKPHVLQAPATNDESAREQAVQIAKYVGFAEKIASILQDLEGNGSNIHTEECLVLAGEFIGNLSNVGAELQGICSQSLAVKFACQTEIKRLLESKQEEQRDSITVFSFKNGLLANAAVAQTHAELQRFMDLFNQHMDLSNQHMDLSNQHMDLSNRHMELTNHRLELLNSRTENQQFGNEEMVRQLVAREVSAVLRDRQTDGRCYAICIVFGNHVIFFNLYVSQRRRILP